MSRLRVDFGHAVSVSAVLANGRQSYQMSDPKNKVPTLMTSAEFKKWLNEHTVEMAPLPDLPVRIEAHPGEPARIPAFRLPGDVFGPDAYELLTNGTDAVKIERALLPLFPQERWTMLSHLLIEHGRQVCDAKKPRCGECLLADVCPSALV
jgi:hypothetical protein